MRDRNRSGGKGVRGDAFLEDGEGSGKTAILIVAGGRKRCGMGNGASQRRPLSIEVLSGL